MFKLLLILFPFTLNATTYYVKASGGTGSGLNDANAWSLAKLNATGLNYGDSVLFKRGDAFTGTLTPISNGINYAAYGSGSNPLLSGFTTLSSWTLSSGNVYYASLDVPRLNVVTLDGVIKPMGRYPNAGYLTYTSHSNNASITGTTVGAIPFNPAGGEVVIRKRRWILDRHPITSRSSNTLNITTSTDYGQNNLYTPVDGNGYFIQNSLSTLDQEGEWFYDTTANRLYMHFGAGTPSGGTVKAGSVDRNVYLNYWTDISFTSLDFEGANIWGVYTIGTSNITYTNCNFTQQGGDGFWGSYLNNVDLIGCTFNDCLNNGIYVEQEGDDMIFDSIYVRSSGQIAGASRSGDGYMEGIFVKGDTVSITRCRVINSGYIGINFEGNEVLVKNNFVDSFSNIKDDGAGIYSYTGPSGGANTNRVISQNIILHGIGSFVGAEAYYWEPYGKAAGIYLDDYAGFTTVDSNIIAHGSWHGIVLHNASNNSITHNIVFDFDSQLGLLQDFTNGVRNNTISNNTFIARSADQDAMYLETFVSDNVNNFGAFNNNVYARPIDDNLTIQVNNSYGGGSGATDYTLATWKSTFSEDAASVKSSVTAVDADKFRIDYNATPSQITIDYKTTFYKDVKGTAFDKTKVLPPFSAAIGIKKGIRIFGKTVIML